MRSFIVILLLSWCVTGCHVLPSATSTPSLPAGSSNPVTPWPVTGPLLPAHAAVQQAANSVAKWFIAAGIVCLCAAGWLGYCGQIIPAVKLGVAGLVCPIFGVWFAWHFAWVIAALLVASAAGFLWANRNTAAAKSVEDRLVKVL